MIRPKRSCNALLSGYSTTMKYLERRALDLQGAEWAAEKCRREKKRSKP
jgi:hypothetical protein